MCLGFVDGGCAYTKCRQISWHSKSYGCTYTFALVWAIDINEFLFGGFPVAVDGAAFLSGADEEALLWDIGDALRLKEQMIPWVCAMFGSWNYFWERVQWCSWPWRVGLVAATHHGISLPRADNLNKRVYTCMWLFLNQIMERLSFRLGVGAAGRVCGYWESGWVTTDETSFVVSFFSHDFPNLLPS